MPSQMDVQIAIVGIGPRGTSCLERICASASQFLHRDGTLTIHVVDPFPPGSGSVWQEDQPSQLLMNTVASEVTLFTNENTECEGPHESKHWGPNLYEWGKDADGFRLGGRDYATRAQYGSYLKWVFHEVCKRAQDSSINIHIEMHPWKAIQLDNEHGLGDNVKQVLTLAKVSPTGEALTKRLPALSAVILTQGHVGQLPDAEQQEFIKHVETRQPKGECGMQYYPPGNPADINFDAIKGGDSVLLRGLGLVFFDYMILLTARRGGWFERLDDGSFKYHKSGNEPTIYAGSRRGIPYHTKDDDQKSTTAFHAPEFLTNVAIENLQAFQPLNFKEHVWPLITKEVKLVYYKTLLEKQKSTFTQEDYRRLIRGLLQENKEVEHGLLKEFGVSEENLWSWGVFEKPQGDKTFSSVDDWNKWLCAHLEKDVEEAKEGSINGPLRASLDVLRNIRNKLRLLLNDWGLESAPFGKDLIDWFTPYNALLSTGPPRRRVEQMIALMKAGVLTVLGPGLKVQPEEEFWLVASKNPDDRQIAHAVIDAFIPPPDLRNTSDELLRYLHDNSQCRVHKIGNYETGAICTAEKTYNMIQPLESAHPRRFAIGVPAESVHWLTPVQPRLCADSINLLQTDAIAQAVLMVAQNDQNCSAGGSSTMIIESVANPGWKPMVDSTEENYTAGEDDIADDDYLADNDYLAENDYMAEDGKFNQDPGVPRNITMHDGEFFSRFEIHYCDKKPEGAINEINGSSPDINKGYRGKYVWLTVERTKKREKMANRIWVEVSRNARPGQVNDLAKGAGGDYRYLQWSNDITATRYITDVALWRCRRAESSPPDEWEYVSEDINRGRGGDYLYLIWRTKPYYDSE